MNLRGLKNRLKMLDPPILIDDDGLQVAAVERVLDSLPPEECKKAEAAISEAIALYECGFSKVKVEEMLTPESKSLLADLEARAAALLPEVKEEVGVRYRRRYVPMAEGGEDAD